jgi:arylsulfatase A-like enzyme
MSGLYPYTNRTLGNAGTLRGSMPDVVTLPQLFRQHGYFTARVSKIYHMRIPADIIAGTTEHDDPQSWDEAINIKGPEHEAGGVAGQWSPKDTSSQTFRSVAASGEDTVHADGMAANQAIKMLGNMNEKPFFLAVGFVRPHVPLVAPTSYFDRYNRDEMIAPAVPSDDLEDVPKIIRNYKENAHRYGITPELHKGLLQAYYASVSYMDAQVGRVLSALEENGLAENTIVVFTSDHGYLLGEHNKFQKQHLFEQSTRVPFIVSVPWLNMQHGQTSKKITELIDLYPTLAELSNLSPPETLHGSSLLPLLKDVNSADWTKQQAFTISRSGGESLRTNQWRFTQWGFGERGYELYDLEKDPGEFTNQANNRQYSQTLELMREQLEEKRLHAGYQSWREWQSKRQKSRQY